MEEAKAAVAGLDGTELYDQKIKVQVWSINILYFENTICLKLYTGSRLSRVPFLRTLG